MEKAVTASDSEDEAFESADEGDVDNRPSTQGGGGSAVEDEGTVSSAEEKLQGSEIQDIANDKELNERNNTEKKDEENLETWKDGSAKEESGVGDTDVLVPDPKKENKEENSDKEPAPENKHIHVSEEANSDKNDSCRIASDAPNLMSDPTEPVAEKIHESIKDTESQSPILQAMDRMAEASSNCASSDVAQPSSSATAPSSSWGWGGWGNMLSKATSSVSSMLETVENQFGIPSPTEMAKLAATSKSNPDNKPPKMEDSSNTDIQPSESETGTESAEEKSEHQNESGAGLSSWLTGLGMSHLSSVVQNTGKEIVTGGLDALEFVGKKTIDAISHGDPGLRRKRVTLSQAIREAKEKAEQSSAHAADDQLNLNVFSVEFDKFQGLAHLEALEMISRESEQELEKLLEARAEESRKDSDELLATLKSMFKVNEDDDEDDEGENDNNVVENFDEIISEQVANLSLSVTPAKLISAFDLSKSKSEKKQDNEDRSIEDFYSETITCFAELTARSVEIFHKIGEFMLLPDVKGSYLAKTRGNALSKICSVLRASISALSIRFATILNERKPDSDDSISKVITDIYFEASNSSSHITDSFRLLSPILQLSSIKHSSLSP